MPSRLPRITLLGRLAIEAEGRAEAATLPGRRSELVFAYLAAEHHRTVSRDELADALWPGVLPDTWAAALRGVVSEVRRFLERGGLDAAEVLVSTSGGYQLRLPPGVVVDLDEARAALAEARERLAAQDAPAAAERAERAAELARLPFLPHHEGDWVDGMRAELEQLRVAALELEVNARRQAGDVRGAAAAAERLVRADRFSESAHRLRIELLAAAGDRGGALRAYEHCRAVLARELGVEPSAETQALLQRALAAPDGEVAADGGALGVSCALVVEDHDFQRRTAVGLLRRLGVATVLEAADGEAALEALAGAPGVEVIVLDIDMPGMDGVELIRRLSEREHGRAVVITSRLDRRLVQAAQAVAESRGLQVLGAVRKPLTARNLSALLAGFRHSGDAERPSVADEPEVGELEAWLEPIVDLSTGRLAAAEVLPRSVTGASASASRLLALAGDVAGAAGVKLAVRVPDGERADAELADRLIAAASDPHRIVLVLGEGTLRAGGQAALEALTRLRAKGFGAWLDGFEGGAALQRMPLTGLRLAPELVTGAAGGLRRVAALQEALDAATSLELPVIGAGCHGADDFELLLQLGCGYAQGTFVAAPMPPADLAGWAASWTPPPVEA